ncbi:MAG: hypothetical protein ABSB35_41155 [Bryobacteraceae bacterium]|jgi:hypothetical protein
MEIHSLIDAIPFHDWLAPHPFLKQLLPALVLRVVRIADREPILPVGAIAPFGNDAFEIPFSDQLEQRAAVPFDVASVEDSRVPGDQPFKLFEVSVSFGSEQGPPAAFLAVSPCDADCCKPRDSCSQDHRISCAFTPADGSRYSE